ncbi:acyl-CoA thioesterase [Companilactobacillus ginsenosidimutans]|uniref:Acyl-CoA hydrolase n=1 Tax=Companilactobacillus ginsenosidimutans TaxID=1007676 RepID=A0A0H4QEW5_9LACO|nr:acyl-CoA thioesterase [Companilactobacillus ginsenosidimutans]AKP66472.1 acyl-CoA hydrolase [Companilactobacillus ginsenosidimutans]
MKQITCSQTKAISDRLVFDGDLNDKGTLFGGKTLSMLDENAGLAAFKFINVKVATANYDYTNFWNPITTKDSIRITSYVTGASERAIEVFTKIATTDLKTYQTKIAFTSFSTLVTLRQFGEVNFPELIPETDEEKFLCSGWQDRVMERKNSYHAAKVFLQHLDSND